jgi:homoserine O-acetyltransferase
MKYFTAASATGIDSKRPSENSALTLAYQIFGSPDNPAVLLPSCFSGRVQSTLSFLYSGSNAVLKDYFVIVCGLLGGSDSSSPSNAPAATHGLNFPKISYEDNVNLQHALCSALGIVQLEAYIGYSMGGQQAYYMAVLYPDFVKRIVVLASSARTSTHNKSCLGGARTALLNSVDWCGGEYVKPALKGTQAFARAYSTWALSLDWFRQKKWEDLGCTYVDDYLQKNWDEGMGAWDAHDLMCMLDCWLSGDISSYGEGKDNLPPALGKIKAKVLLMLCRTDLFFPPEDSEEELKHLRYGVLRVIESVWGHLAGGEWAQQQDREFIMTEVQRFLIS